MKCKNKDCDKEAIFRCYWPGKTVYYCERCRDIMKGVAEAMGFEVATEFIDQETYEASKGKEQ